MSDRVIYQVRKNRDECPCHPSVDVIMHDGEWTPAVARVFFEAVTLGLEPPEITAARATLPDTPCVDHFAREATDE